MVILKRVRNSIYFVAGLQDERTKGVIYAIDAQTDIRTDKRTFRVIK